MKKLNSLASLGLAAALSANGCGGSVEISNPQEAPITETDAGQGGSAGEEGSAGVGGSAGQGGTGPDHGTVTIKNDIDPSEIVGQTPEALIARFGVEADAVEDQLISHIRLKIHATGCDGTGINAPINLYQEGSSSPIATGQYQDQGGYIAYLDFDFPTPYMISKSDTNFFQIYADQAANCCHFTEETFLENNTDITAIGSTYGLPSTVINQYSENDPHSTVNIWGGKVFVDLSSQPALNIPIGTQQASCMETTVYNCLPENLELSNLQAQLEITNGDGTTDAKDLLNNNPAQGNFTGVKLLERDFNGIPLNTLLGPNELNPTGSDVMQYLALSGNVVLPPGERAVLSLSFNVEENQALIGNQIRCTLINLPENDLMGNIHTIVDQDFPCINVAPSSFPTSAMLQKGAQDVNIACWDFTNTCYQTNLTALKSTMYGTGIYSDFNALRIFYYGLPVSDFANPNLSNGEVTFNNFVIGDEIYIHFGTGEQVNLCAHTNVSYTATTGSQLGMQITAPADLSLNPPTNIGGQFPAQGPTFGIGNN